mmetsp:Transcript_26710/g.82168  ORF Transcript_26710/g.82168 Transcript_26710/m.82168 type:complete len:125 (+) Transcript_26710:230-604(+)
MAQSGARFCACAIEGDATPLPPLLAAEALAARNVVACSSVVVARSVLVAAGGFGEERYGQDWRCWQRCLALGPGAVVAAPLVRLNGDAADLDRSTVRAEGRQALRAALGDGAPAALAASFAGFL